MFFVCILKLTKYLYSLFAYNMSVRGPNILKQFIHLILTVTQIRKPRSGVAQYLTIDHTVHKCQNQTSCPNEEYPTPTSLLIPRLIHPSSFFVFTRNLKLHMLDLLLSPLSYWTSFFLSQAKISVFFFQLRFEFLSHSCPISWSKSLGVLNSSLSKQCTKSD